MVALTLAGVTTQLSWGVSACAADGPTDTRWQTVETSARGIVVRKRSGSSDALSAFQGDGIIRGNVLHVLAVILDASQVEHWAYGISDATRVTGKDDSDELLYLFSDTPWPVRDRDMVVRREVEVVRPAEAFRVHMTCEPKAIPERSGVVRVQHCASSFLLERASDDTTRVTYETQIDPAGSLPAWASQWVAKTVPLRTLEALEARAQRKDGRYASFVRRWSKAL
jgi:hypothetical protein